MKLGTKIFAGFAITNAVYLLLFATVFFFVKPEQDKTEVLNKYVLTAFGLANDVRYQVSEQRSAIRHFMASAADDRKIFDEFLSYNKATVESIGSMDRLLSEPGAAPLRTQELHRIAQAVPSYFREFTDQAAALPESRDKLLKTRLEFEASYREAFQTLKNALQVEKDTFDEEQRGEADRAVINRRVGRISDLNTILESLAESYLNLVLAFARQSQEYSDRSQGKLADAERDISVLLADTKNQGVRAALEKAQATIKADYAPRMKAVMDLAREDAEAAAGRDAVIESLVAEVAKFTAIIDDLARQYTNDMSSAISQAIWVMLIGAAAALAVSIFLALWMTRSMVRAMDRIIENLLASAQEVDGASAQLTRASNTLAKGASENAASLEETSAALEEFSSMTKKNADNAVEANSLMTQATGAMQKAEGSMTQVIQAMEEISASGNEIGKIIKTIDEIAFQTNLLALNAAVEAARAGEAGAGFAVVADEVRNLAIRSADAAKHTADLIATTIGNINSGSEMVNATSEAFQTVGSHTAKVSELVSEVAEASKEQSLGINQIATAMAEMDKVTQSNAASAEESASAASQLSNEASNLSASVNEIDIMLHGAEAAGGAARAGGGRAKQPARLSSVPSQKTATPAPAADRNKALPMDDDFDDF